VKIINHSPKPIPIKKQIQYKTQKSETLPPSHHRRLPVMTTMAIVFT